MTPSSAIAHNTNRNLVEAFYETHPNGLTPQQHSQRLNSDSAVHPNSACKKGPVDTPYKRP